MTIRPLVCLCVAVALPAGSAAQEPKSVFDSERDATTTEMSRRYTNLAALAFTPDGKKLVMATGFRNLIVHDIARKEAEAGDDFLEHVPATLAVSPDGRTAAGLMPEAAGVVVWDVASLKHRHRIKWPDATVAALAFAPDSKTLYLAGQGNMGGTTKGLVRAWDVVRARPKETTPVGDAPLTAIALSALGKRMAVGTKDGEVRVLPLGDDSPDEKSAVDPAEKHTGPVTVLAFDPDGKHLLSGGEDRTVRLWDLATGKELAALAGHARPVTLVGFLADGRTPFSGSQGDGTVRFWDVAGEKERAIVRREGYGTAVAVSADRKLAATGGPKGLIVWDLGPLYPKAESKPPEKPAK
jgi:WD40 repeat protein